LAVELQHLLLLFGQKAGFGPLIFHESQYHRQVDAPTASCWAGILPAGVQNGVLLPENAMIMQTQKKPVAERNSANIKILG